MKVRVIERVVNNGNNLLIKHTVLYPRELTVSGNYYVFNEKTQTMLKHFSKEK